MATPASVIQQIQIVAHKEVINEMSPDVLDQTDQPWRVFIEGKKTERSFSQGYAQQKVRRKGGIKGQKLGRKDIIQYHESEFYDQLEYSPFKEVWGQEIVHDDIEDMGLSIDPFQLSSLDVKRIPKADSKIMLNYMKDLDKSLRQDMNDDLDIDYLADGSGSALERPGLDGILPLDNTSGTIFGKNRADSLFQHTVITGTTAATMDRDIMRGVRYAQENTAGGGPKKIDFIMAGDDWIDLYATVDVANSVSRVNRVAGKAAGVDIATPDDMLSWNGIPVRRNPSFNIMDAAGLGGSTAFAKRAYFLTQDAWELGYAPNKFKHYSKPVDPSDQLISRIAYFNRAAPFCRYLNRQFVNAIA